MRFCLYLFTILAVVSFACGYSNQYHVSINGSDANPGTASKPFKSISAAAKVAVSGDVITVHEGIYRERVNPPRGGDSDKKRITYQSAKGETVIVRGSEIVTGWNKVENDTWKVILPNSLFGEFNPYDDPISGDWYRNREGAKNHTGALYLNGQWFAETFTLNDVLKPASGTSVWYAQVDEKNTTIWAQFKGDDPNKEIVEINVRQSVFYPDKPGRNYITVRGFTMEHAATPWAPPTAEQIGLIGTHWSKGWIIEDNTVRHSACTGITLGKHGDEFDNTSQNSAEGYVETIKRALKRGWSKENIGHHIVRNNHISHCGQSGIVGSMGAAFSTLTGNEIHDIHLNRSFGGAEMAGIKIHGAIDTLISNNHIYRCGDTGGIWLDWMAQGTRVTGNLLHDNVKDIFVEVNHGPFLFDNNISLSAYSMLEGSGGGAYVNNLFAGEIKLWEKTSRDTPYMPPHGTEIAGLAKFVGDDERFFNNLFAGYNGLSGYDQWKCENLKAEGNVYLAGAKPSSKDRNAVVIEKFDSGVSLSQKQDGWYLEMTVDPAWQSTFKRSIVTTDILPKTIISGLPFVMPDGKPYRIDTNYFGDKRGTENPFPGPFEASDKTRYSFKVWSKNKTDIPMVTASKPNILIIFTDDQGYGDLGCYGSPTNRTPRMDKLARDGIRFTNFYAQSVCGPSRSALLTGRNPSLSRGWDMTAVEITWAELMQGAGYQTACIGKWDVSHRKEVIERMPNAQGFDYYFGTLGANDNGKVSFHENNNRAGKTDDMSTLIRLYTDKAIDYLENKRDKNKPFALYIAHNMMHTIIDASEEFKGKSKGSLYGDVVEEFDCETGRLLDAVDRLGLRDNTLVIYTTDNGPWNQPKYTSNKKGHPEGSVFWGDAGPLRNGKGTCYEGGMRVPCIVRWPGVASAGIESDAIFSTLDFMPTFANIAGFQVPEDRIIDGVDQTDILTGKNPEGPRDVFYYEHMDWRNSDINGVRKGKWKYLKANQLLASYADDDRVDKSEQLYDLESDIGEKNNLAKKYPEKVKELRNMLDNYIQSHRKAPDTKD